MMPNLAVLDGKDAQGEEVMSGESDEEEDYGGEEGESDDEDFDQQEYIDKISKQLTEEQKKDLEAQGISVQQYLEGQGEDFSEEDAEADEYGSDEDGYGDQEGDEDGESGEGGPNKRAKKED